MSANKSFSSETSERYARALFELSKESNELEKTENDISNFKLLYYGSDEIKNFVKDPSKSITQQNEVVNFIGEKLEFSKNLKSFFLLLVKKRRIFFINKILESFLRLCTKKRGELKASLISSRELSKSELDRISKDLSDTMGSYLKLDYKVDKDLIGGLKLQLGSFMIDTSIKNKLKKYEQLMIEN